MNKQFSFETGICIEHQRLFEESERALETWNDRRATFCQAHLTGKEAGNELLRLQAKYARAYATLWSHERNCSLCQLTSRMEEPESQNSSRASTTNELHTWF
jgi:hypothetical protein